MPYLQYQRTAHGNDVTLKMPAFEWVHAAPSGKGDDKFITTDYLQQCQNIAPLRILIRNGYRLKRVHFFESVRFIFPCRPQLRDVPH